MRSMGAEARIWEIGGAAIVFSIFNFPLVGGGQDIAMTDLDRSLC